MKGLSKERQGQYFRKHCYIRVGEQDTGNERDTANKSENSSQCRRRLSIKNITKAADENLEMWKGYGISYGKHHKEIK